MQIRMKSRNEHAARTRRTETKTSEWTAPCDFALFKVESDTGGPHHQQILVSKVTGRPAVASNVPVVLW